MIDETVLVDTDEICAAIKDGFNDVRVVLEPAGALGIGKFPVLVVGFFLK